MRRKKRLRKYVKNYIQYRGVFNPPTPRNQPRVSTGAGREEKLLCVRNEFFSANATFEKVYGVWHCSKADPIIKWMVKMSPDQAKLALLKMDAQWGWSNVNHEHPLQSSTRPVDPVARVGD